LLFCFSVLVLLCTNRTKQSSGVFEKASFLQSSHGFVRNDAKLFPFSSTLLAQKKCTACGVPRQRTLHSSTSICTCFLSTPLEFPGSCSYNTSTIFQSSLRTSRAMDASSLSSSSQYTLFPSHTQLCSDLASHGGRLRAHGFYYPAFGGLELLIF